MTWGTVLAIAAGGAVGAVCRAGVSLWLEADFPWATLVVNVLGSLLIGLVFGWEAANGGPSAMVRLMVTVGFCGAFTTFSTFSYQTLALMMEGRPFWALGNIVLSLIGCLLAVGCGLRLSTSLLGR